MPEYSSALINRPKWEVGLPPAAPLVAFPPRDNLNQPQPTFLSNSRSQTANNPKDPTTTTCTMEALQTAPETSTFVPLAEYQSQTPSSFHSGPPVLHYHSQRCKVVILERDLIATPALNALRGSQSSTNGATDAQGSEDGEGNEVAIDGVETWVTSE